MANKYTVMGMPLQLDAGDIDELTFSSVIRYVNEECQKVIEEHPTLKGSSQMIVTLTAVRIADDLLKMKSAQKNDSDKYERKIKELIRAIDEVEHIN